MIDEHVIEVRPPFRLDLTVAVLRRFSTSVVDVTTADGTYLRALAGGTAPAVVAVRQPEPTTLAVAVDGLAADRARDLALVRRMLGTERTTPHFDRAAARIPWLRELARRVRGVRTPRYPTLWEACVNAIVFQQVSLHAATAILRRTILALGAPVEHAGTRLYTFPGPDVFAGAGDAGLRAAGLSVAKIATLRRVASALASGDLEETALEALSTPAATARLCELKGIGPWTAAVIALRGLGRLDVFPMNDSGIARSVAAIGGPSVDLDATLAALGPERGMLYYHLLLGRLIAAGEVVLAPRQAAWRRSAKAEA